MVITIAPPDPVKRQAAPLPTVCDNRGVWGEIRPTPDSSDLRSYVKRCARNQCGRGDV